MAQSGSNEIMKIDIDNAYLSALSTEDINLPYGNRREILLYDQAKSFLDKYIEGSYHQEFIVVKVSLTFQHKMYNGQLPFFECNNSKYNKRNKLFSSIQYEKSSILSFCQKCSETAPKTKNVKKLFCCHKSQNQRAIMVTCLGEDIKLALG